MAKFLPDQSFYPSPKMAMEAAPEKLAYVALLNPHPTARMRWRSWILIRRRRATGAS